MPKEKPRSVCGVTKLFSFGVGFSLIFLSGTILWPAMTLAEFWGVIIRIGFSGILLKTEKKEFRIWHLRVWSITGGINLCGNEAGQKRIWLYSKGTSRGWRVGSADSQSIHEGCNSSFWVSDTLFWPPNSYTWHKNIHAGQTCIHIKIFKIN